MKAISHQTHREKLTKDAKLEGCSGYLSYVAIVLSALDKQGLFSVSYSE